VCCVFSVSCRLAGGIAVVEHKLTLAAADGTAMRLLNLKEDAILLSHAMTSSPAAEFEWHRSLVAQVPCFVRPDQRLAFSLGPVNTEMAYGGSCLWWRCCRTRRRCRYCWLRRQRSDRLTCVIFSGLCQ
jgi:hypothetical protein